MFRLVLLTIVFTSVTVSGDMNKTKLIIDNDAGGDDAMAIFLALLYEKHYNGPKLIGLTTGNGNTIEENVCVNNQRILQVANRQDVPIYRGSKTSIVTTPSVDDYYGKDGLGDSDDVITNLIPAQKQHAVLWLIEQSQIHDGNLIVITIGTVTNVALAIKLDPNFLGRLAHLYIGAGHIHDDDNPTAEFNPHMDVEAYHIIAQNASPAKVTVIPFSQIKSSLNISKPWRENVLGAIDTDIIKAQNKFERIALQKEERWQALDPAVAAIALKPDLVKEYKYSKNDIIMCGDRRGINTNTFVEKDDANVRVIYSVKEEEYKQFLLDVFSTDATNKNT